jgi:hypothetical protein
VFTWSLHFSWSHSLLQIDKMRNSSIDPIPYLLFVFALVLFMLNGDWDFFCFDRLEPLVFRIKEKRSAILCPGIDMISEQNMAYGVSDG